MFIFTHFSVLRKGNEEFFTTISFPVPYSKQWVSLYNNRLFLTKQPVCAPQVGLEPTTLRLTAECSAIELLRIIDTDSLPLRYLWNPATTYSPGPFPAKYHQRGES